MSESPKWAFWRTRPRLSESEAAHLLCNIEPPAANLSPATNLPARVGHALEALQQSGVVKSKGFDNQQGAQLVVVGSFRWVELSELLAAIEAGRLPGLGAELRRNVRGPREAGKPSQQQQREEALRAWLAAQKIPETEWKRLNLSREHVRQALAKHDRELFADLKPSTFLKFWKHQHVCQLRR